jgi:hypothetical protein
MAGDSLNEHCVSRAKHGGLPDPDRPGHQQDGNHVEEGFHIIRRVVAALTQPGPGDPVGCAAVFLRSDEADASSGH